MTVFAATPHALIGPFLPAARPLVIPKLLTYPPSIQSVSPPSGFPRRNFLPIPRA